MPHDMSNIKSDLNAVRRTRHRRSAPVILWSDTAKFPRTENLRNAGYLPRPEVPYGYRSIVHYTGKKDKAIALGPGLSSQKESDCLWATTGPEVYPRRKWTSEGPFEPRDIRLIPGSMKHVEGGHLTSVVGQRVPSKVRQNAYEERFAAHCQLGMKDPHAQIIMHDVGITQDFQPKKTKAEEDLSLQKAKKYGMQFAFHHHIPKHLASRKLCLLYNKSLSYIPPTPRRDLSVPAGVSMNGTCGFKDIDQMRWNWQWCHARVKERGSIKLT